MKRIGLALLLVPALAACREDVEHFDPPALLPKSERIVFPAALAPVSASGHEGDLRIRSLINIPRKMNYGEYRWNDGGIAPAKLWVLVDLKRQTMSVFRGQDEIGTSVTLYGVDGKPTPTGRFRIRAMLKDHRSSIYDAEMPYTLRLTDDGIAIHGSDVRQGVGTHGCLGIPLGFAKLLFEEASPGDEVLILDDSAAQFRAPPQTTASNEA